MRRLDWWLGIAILSLALLAHAAFPRYEWRHVGGMVYSRIDRWTGTIEPHVIRPRQ